MENGIDPAAIIADGLQLGEHAAAINANGVDPREQAAITVNGVKNVAILREETAADTACQVESLTKRSAIFKLKPAAIEEKWIMTFKRQRILLIAWGSYSNPFRANKFQV